MAAGNIKYCPEKKKTTVKAVDSGGLTALDQVVREGFSAEVTVEQRQRDEECDKSQLCKSQRRAWGAGRISSAKALGWECFGTLGEG